MPMSDGKIGRWGAVVREAFAVLAAILVAFALDAWWDQQVEYRDMLEALDAVGREVERNIEEIDSTLVFNGGQADLVAEALALAPDRIAAMSDAEVMGYVELPSYQLVTLRMGAATAFIEGGYLATLDDRDLRARIAGLPREQLELDEEADVVTVASNALNEALVSAFAGEAFADPRNAITPATMRTMLTLLAADGDPRRAIFNRTFFLNTLYGGELALVRDNLADVGASIDEVLEAGR